MDALERSRSLSGAPARFSERLERSRRFSGAPGRRSCALERSATLSDALEVWVWEGRCLGVGMEKSWVWSWGKAGVLSVSFAASKFLTPPASTSVSAVEVASPALKNCDSAWLRHGPT